MPFNFKITFCTCLGTNANAKSFNATLGDARP